MADITPLRKLAEMANTGKKYPAMKLVGGQLKSAAIISKLVKDRNVQPFNIHDKNSFYNLDTSGFKLVSDEVAEKMRAAENIMQLFPDLELAAQILISSILSPKDMVSTEVIYKFSESVMPASLSAQFISAISEEMEKHYGFKKQLPDILREAMFISGAYVKAVIPESAVDDVINSQFNVSTESIAEILDSPSIGILGNPVVQSSSNKLSMESIRAKYKGGAVAGYNQNLHIATESNSNPSPGASKMMELVQITDNFKYLKLPHALKTLSENSIRNTVRSVSTESAAVRFSDKEITDMFFRKVDPKEVPFVAVKTRDQTSRPSVGRPMDMKIPTEATIPVYIPGDPKTHVGYFILLDEEGNPLVYTRMLQVIGSMNASLTDNTNQVTTLLTQRAKRNLIGNSDRNLFVNDYTKAYKGIIEGDLIYRLKNGIYGQRLELGASDQVYQMMMARTLAGQYTRLLYVPAEMVTYFALNFTTDGIGKSLLDDLKVLTSLRAILLFAKVMAMAKNSIAVTHVNMTIDPDDPDPMKTIETGINEVIKMRQQYFPLGINTPLDLVDWVQRAGLEFTFEGHPGIPQTKFDFESKNFQHQLPDNELDELLRKQTIMAFGLSPETVDNGFASEFATTVLANNILLSKRVLQWQDKLTPCMTGYVKQVIRNDFTVRERLYTLIENELASVDRYLDADQKTLRDHDQKKFINYLIDYYSTYLEITLPRPNVTSVETLSSAFDQQSEALDKALEFWVSSSFMTEELVGEVSQSIDAVKVALKAYFMRQWMSENGFMTELADIVSTNEEDKPVLDLNEINKEHIQGVMRGVLEFLKTLENARSAGNKDVQKMNVEGSGSIEPSTPSSSSETESQPSEGGEEGGGEGGGDFDLGDDISI